LRRPPGAGAVHFRRAVSQGHCARSSRPFQPQLNETALHRVRTGHFGESFAIPARMESTGILNAKAQRLRGAKRFFRLGVLATWRLCVELSLNSLSVKSAVHCRWLRLCRSGIFAHFLRQT
jgi:hypothetical protein